MTIYQFLFSPIHALSQDALIQKLAFFLSYPITYLTILLILIWAIFYSRRKLYSFALFFLTGLTAWFLAHFVKVVLRVPRPFVAMDFKPIHLEPGFSFPSEHTAVLTALTFAMFFLNKRLGWILLLTTILVGVSRVILGVHYPMDIIGGLVLGYFVAWLYKKLFRKL